MSGVKLRTAGVRADGRLGGPRLRAGVLRERPRRPHRSLDALPRAARRGLDRRPPGDDREPDPTLQDPHSRRAGRAGAPDRGQPRGHPPRLRGRGRLLRQHSRPRNGPGRRRPGPGRLHALRSPTRSTSWSSSTSGSGSRTRSSPSTSAARRASSPRTSASSEAEGPAEIRPAERAKAAAVFARNYPRAFTIESSLDGNLLSFMPQGDEVGLEFKARKAGEMAYIFSPFSGDEVSLYDHGKERVVCLYSPAPADAPPAEEDVHLVRGEVRRQRVLARPELRPGQFLHLGPGPHRGRPPGRPPRDAQVPLQSRFRDPQDHGRRWIGSCSTPRTGPATSLYVHFVEPPVGREPTAIEVFYRGPLKPVAADDRRRLPDRLGRRQHPRPAPLRDLLLFPRRFLVPGPGRGGLLPGPPDPRRPARIRVRRQRGAGGPGPAGRTWTTPWRSRRRAAPSTPSSPARP
ncbi:MAG: hypothetical protein M0C28_15330 [Candidatus Moduliflexus flocculans]|nr:hypothetical protein [Candidatus Moduliflexus flocculans]